MMTLIAPDSNCMMYVVAWHAHADNWVEIARLPNGSDAREVAAMFNSKLGTKALCHGECYAFFRVEDFDNVVQR